MITGFDVRPRALPARGAAVATATDRERGFPAAHSSRRHVVGSGCANRRFQSGIRVGHVEAGLRTGTTLTPYPEELNRQSPRSVRVAPIEKKNVREGIDERVLYGKQGSMRSVAAR